MSEEEFHRYWREEHGPLVRSLATAIGTVRYVQSHTIAPEQNAVPQASRAADRMLRADETGFIDLRRSAFILTAKEVFLK